MWLFSGRYAQFGPIICAIVLGIATVGIVFIVLAARLVRRTDVSAARAAAVIIAVVAAATFTEAQAFGEPVFVANSLNRGAALLFAIVGISLGVGGVIVSRKRRVLGVLLLVAASGVLFGDLVGWVRRSRGPAYRAEATPSSRQAAAKESSLRNAGLTLLGPSNGQRGTVTAQQRLQPAGLCRIMAPRLKRGR